MLKPIKNIIFFISITLLLGVTVFRENIFGLTFFSQFKLLTESLKPSFAVSNNYHEMFDDLEQQYNIDILYEKEDAKLPVLWSIAPANGRTEALEDDGIRSFALHLPGLLEQYPSRVIQRYLKAIVLFKSMTLYEVGYGGTYLGGTLYFTWGGEEQGYTELYLKETFHHEMSSVLLEANPNHFKIKKWSEVNPSSFQYLQTTQSILQAVDGHSERVDQSLLEAGFLNSYGQVTLEDDFNLYAQTIFSDPAEMKQLMNTYPNIHAKYLLVKEFYLNLSKDFSPIFNGIEN